MKNIVIAFSLFIGIILMSFFSIKYINKTCGYFLDLNAKIQNSLKSEEYNKATAYLKTFENSWDKKSNTLSVYIHHAETDDISMEIEKLSQSIKYKEKKDAMESTHSLNFLIKHVVNLEKINIQNIF